MRRNLEARISALEQIGVAKPDLAERLRQARERHRAMPPEEIAKRHRKRIAWSLQTSAPEPWSPAGVLRRRLWDHYRREATKLGMLPVT